MKNRSHNEPPSKSWIIANTIAKPDSGCWIWTRAVGKNGRGVMRVGKRSAVSVARVVWELWMGQIPPKMCVCHHCDNKLCCNPDHLFIGTHKDNTKDCMDKRRWWSNARLKSQVSMSRDDVERIKGTNGTNEGVAKLFGVSDTTIWRIRNGNYCPHAFS